MDSQIIYKSIEEYLKKVISDKEKSIARRKEKLKNSNIFEKNRYKHEINDYNKKIINIQNFEKDLFNFKNSSYSKNDYKLPVELKNQLEGLANKLNDEERIYLENKVNIDLKKENYFKKIVGLNKEKESLKKSADNTFSNGTIINVHNYNIPYGNHSIKELIDDLAREQKEKLNYDSYTIKFSKQELSEPENRKIVEVTSMINSVDIFDNKKMNNIKANYTKIRENQINKIKSEKILGSIENLISDIEREMQISNVDFKNVIDNLQQIKENANKNLNKANEFLSKFDLSVIDKELENHQKQVQKDAQKDKYMQIVYDREIALAEGNLIKAEELRQQMLACGEKYDNEELMDMQSKMQHKAYQDQYVEKIVKEGQFKEEQEKRNRTIEEKLMYEQGRKEQIIQERKKEIEKKENHLRELAKEKLTHDGVQYDEEKDKYLIEAEVEKMKKIAQMTPYERAIDDGVHNPNDFAFYNDEFMGFNVNDFKATQKQLASDMNSQATSIYKEYIKYIAKQQNKNEAMKFSEFASVKYGHLGMNESMVDEEILNEGRAR